MEKLLLNNKMIGEIVAEDFRAAEIFKNAGIDFCCGGKMGLEQACAEKNINLEQFISKLNELQNEPADRSQNFKDWDLAFLCDYIVNTHHQYVLKTLPQLVAYTQKIASVHGNNHAELIEIGELFGKINMELVQHLRNEEEVLFPAIKEVLKTNSTEAKTIIVSEISRMNGEHEFAGGAMDKINEITNGYTVPSDGCNTYMVTFKLLKQFEDDLHIHVHLENNILFPKALKL
jgi:regulator of cell morphogenesis and NO signaling